VVSDDDGPMTAPKKPRVEDIDPDPDLLPALCKSCGVAVSSHLGLEGTCAKLLVAEKTIRDLRSQVKMLQKRGAWK